MRFQTAISLVSLLNIRAYIKNMHGKIPIRTASLIVAILGWLLVTALAAFIIWSLRDRARIIRDKDNEQIINILFASLRGYDDFGVAIEANPLLKERITGFAMYNVDFSPIYRWGDTPAVFDERLLGNRTRTPHKNDFFELRSFGRYISSSPGERSTRVVFHTDRLIPRMPPLLSEDDRPEDNKQYGYPNRETETYGHPTMGTETLGLSAGTETYGLPSAGTETYGLPTTGTETLGLSAGTETYGLPTMGTETLGLSAGTETYGLPSAGTETYGLPTTGTETYGLPTTGTETYGLPTMGTETYGLSSAGTETYGLPTTGTETLGLSAGTETYGLSTMGTETYGLPTTGTETYGLSSAGTEADIGMQLQKVRSRLSGAEKGAQRVITIAPQEYFTLMISLAKGEYIYIDIIHPTFWITHIATLVFLPIWELAFLFLMWYIRRLYLRNHEYRERIEAQKNLVVLGTAASTLAHEIKNPLLSIRLQTSILKKLYPDGSDEVAIIDDEVERIAALIYRVNDYLREAEGSPVTIKIGDFVNETSRRLCGRNIVSEESASNALVSMDTERARSVFENIVRNALEAGGNEADVGASIVRVGSMVVVSVFDRGKGIAEADLKRVFDPFFTKKSTGTGIGLAISKRFVEAVGGTIELANREGGGAVAMITLPECKID